MKVLITGADGFLGQNLIAHLRHREDVAILGYDLRNTRADLHAWLDTADFVVHLAGVNRPQNEDEFLTGNASLTNEICECLARRSDPPPILLSSSIQADLDNPYGRSKRLAEEAVTRYAKEARARAIIYRLKNVFGKWSRPNYNTVVATFCHSIAHDLPITISDPTRDVELIHIDDVVQSFTADLDGPRDAGVVWRDVTPSYRVTLGRLAELIRSCRTMRQTLHMPDFADPFVRKLYGMYLTYLDEGDFAYELLQRCDNRGCLAEFIKAHHFGQIFVSRTKPGITRGNHYHHTKAEKFLVLEGEAVIRFRSIRGQRSEVRGQRAEGRGQRSEGRDQGAEVIEYRVSGKDFRVIDIPPGYSHSIENVGEGDLVTLFWASEIFDPERPDTFGCAVL